MSLKIIKGKIKSVNKTRQVTKAMEAVSAVKMRKSQAAALEVRPYALVALSLLKRLSATIDSFSHPLVVERPVVKTGFVVITSDKGLAGSLNSAVLKEVHKHIEEHRLRKEDLGFICIGKKGFEHFSKRGFTILDHFEKWGENVALDNPQQISDMLVSLHTQKLYDEFFVVYTNFESTLQQKVVVRKVLPLSFDSVQEIVTGIVPVKGKFSELKNVHDVEDDRVREYIFEPTAEKILDELLTLLINVELFHSLVEANASEHSSRMVAMKNASDKARDMSKDLTRRFNKERQSTITREVSEIIGGIEAMA